MAGGVGDLLAESNDRWAKAARRARGLADYGLGKAVKAYYTLYFPVGFVALTALGTWGAMLILGDAGEDGFYYLALGFFIAGLGAMVGGFVYNAKKVRPAAEPGTIDVTLSLQGQEKKDILRQIRGRAAMEPAHLAVSRGAAVQLRKNLATQLILAPMLPLVLLPQAVPGSSIVWPLMAVGIGAQIIAVVVMARDFRQTGRFLTQTAEQAPTPKV